MKMMRATSDSSRTNVSRPERVFAPLRASATSQVAAPVLASECSRTASSSPDTLRSVSTAATTGRNLHSHHLYFHALLYIFKPSQEARALAAFISVFNTGSVDRLQSKLSIMAANLESPNFGHQMHMAADGLALRKIIDKKAEGNRHIPSNLPRTQIRQRRVMAVGAYTAVGRWSASKAASEAYPRKGRAGLSEPSS